MEAQESVSRFEIRALASTREYPSVFRISKHDHFFFFLPLFSVLTAVVVLDVAGSKELFAKGAQIMLAREEGAELLCAEREAELDRLHSAQRETLGLELSWLPEPRVKHTKRFLELQLAKAGQAST